MKRKIREGVESGGGGGGAAPFSSNVYYFLRRVQEYPPRENEGSAASLDCVRPNGAVFSRLLLFFYSYFLFMFQDITVLATRP